jgi:hypothetical protein
VCPAGAHVSTIFFGPKTDGPARWSVGRARPLHLSPTARHQESTELQYRLRGRSRSLGLHYGQGIPAAADAGMLAVPRRFGVVLAYPAGVLAEGAFHQENNSAPAWVNLT